jgi:hypothetical protein
VAIFPINNMSKSKIGGERVWDSIISSLI